MTIYPAQIDNNVSLPRVVDNQTPVGGETVNRLRDAIIAIENELGAKPSGTFATVRARMDHIENLITQQVVTIAGDLGGTPSHPLVIGFQGRPVSSAAPSPTQVMGWNGIVWEPTGSIQLAQDLGNTYALPFVTGLQGLPVSTQVPTANQVLTWDGYIWKPVTQIVTLNILPTVTLLPVDIVFLGGDGYAGTTSPFRIGARAVDMSPYPSTTLDGRIRTMTFKADLEVTNPAATATVQLKDVTHNVIITNSVLTTQSQTSVELSGTITSGNFSGVMRTDVVSMYEVQIFLTGGSGTDQVICRNARINISYSPPAIISTLLALAMPTDISFVAGTELNGFATPAGIGGRLFDVTQFPALMTDGSGRTRSMEFFADVEVSAAGVDGYCQLFDTTHNVAVGNTLFHFTNTVATEINSVPLTVGTAPGNIRSDISTRYEVQLWKVSNSVTDRVICNNARITIVYQ
jgi:hypothetical protein